MVQCKVLRGGGYMILLNVSFLNGPVPQLKKLIELNNLHTVLYLL